MAVSPTSLSSTATLLQDVRSSQSSSANKAAFNAVVEKQQSNKSTSVAEQLKSQSADKASLKVDIKIGDDSRDEKKQLNLTQSFNREAPISGGQRQQAPGSVLDISV